MSDLIARREGGLALKWPKTTPIDKSDPYWKFNNNMTINGVPYRKEEVAPGDWEWTVDEETLTIGNAWENQRRDLWWALQTRVLNEEEMLRVRGYGDRLNIEPNVSYFAHEKARELNDALARQAELQLKARNA